MADEFLSQAEIDQVIQEAVTCHYVPASVYRVQFNKDCRFKDIQKSADFFSELGVDALYCSPYFEAAPNSVHGYNVTNPTRINPEVGSQEEYESFCQTLAEKGIHQIVDLVPNHMGILGNNNIWWNDVLENGPSSVYSHFFDIDWDPDKKGLKNKVLLPFLGEHYGKTLEEQQIQLCFSPEAGEFWFSYYEHRFPVAPKTYPRLLLHNIRDLEKKLTKNKAMLIQFKSVVEDFKRLPGRTERNKKYIQLRNHNKELAKRRLAELCASCSEIKTFVQTQVKRFNGRKGDAKSFDLLDKLLNDQAYRLAYWRVAAEEINYRRFFDINELAAIRIEDRRVFNHYHRLLFELIRRGYIQGLRIDHPDGLYDPPEYFSRLQRRYLLSYVMNYLEKKHAKTWPPHHEVLEAARKKIVRKLHDPRWIGVKPLYVVVEKILERQENIPEKWNVHGTVGYEFLNRVNGLFVCSQNEKAFTQIYTRFTSHEMNFEDLVYEKKKFFALVHMSSEINALARLLDEISEEDRHHRDFTLNNLVVAIRELIACFPVYRTYMSPSDASPSKRDEKYITQSIALAKKKAPALNPDLFDFLGDILMLRLSHTSDEPDRQLYRDFVLRFQQLTAPLMAKGLEDTTFYIYNRFISLNEVGGDPTWFGVSTDEFHHYNVIQNEKWPESFLTTSTHDCKRSEDARMRINVLSEIPEEWDTKIRQWTNVNEKNKTLIQGKSVPERNVEYLIYQSLISVFPDEAMNDANRKKFFNRFWAYILKSIREAKLETSWIRPNQEYEEAVRHFVAGLIYPDLGATFLESFVPFQRKVAKYGKLNSLSQLVLKLGSPGVVDIYQGNALWHYALVDPDNRRPTDFDHRFTLLKEVKEGFDQEDKIEERLNGLYEMIDDGRLKLYLTWRGLQLRKQYHDLFVGGEYTPLKISGPMADHLIACSRVHEKSHVIVIAARFFTSLLGEDEKHISPSVWKETKIELPDVWQGEWKDVFSGRIISIAAQQAGCELLASEALKGTTVSILLKNTK